MSEQINIDGGNYPASPLTPFVDAMGKEFIVANSRLVPNGPFGIRVFMRPNDKAKWQVLLFKQDSWGQLYLLQGKLYLYSTDSKWKIWRDVIPQYVNTKPRSRKAPDVQE